jgi:CIC family chloride channel protein
MCADTVSAAKTRGHDGSLVALALLALLVGATTGLVCALFRMQLAQADHLRGVAIGWAHGHTVAGFALVVIACALATFVAAWWVVRLSPHAVGSGIPHVEAVLHGELPPESYLLAPVKFVGGVLAIGAGLALGREGPSVQIGASTGAFLGRVFRRSWPDCRTLLAAGAGAGLAAAFNAPIAGAAFVLEELVRSFEPRIAIATLAASSAAIAVARAMIGDAPDFDVATLAHPSAGARPLFLVFGCVAGLLAIAYNRTLLAAIAACERLGKLWRLSVPVRAGLIGGLVGALAWFAPDVVGGGDPITQRALAGADALGFVALVFVLRFALGPLSYAAATPGGLFAPLLVLGAQSGLLFGAACRLMFPDLDIEPQAFAVVGLAAFFTGVVRAPLTGIVLVTEITGNVTLLLPMLGACFTAMLVPTLLREQPIYDSLLEHTRRREKLLREAGHKE